MNYTREIIKEINNLSYSKSAYQVFYDWLTCNALTISNCLYFNEIREVKFKKIISQYPADVFSKMTGMLIKSFEDHVGDILGELFMTSGWSNKNTGQFFTPYSLSLACAEGIKYYPNEITKMNEPSAGAGGMIIATAEAMKKQGINYQKQLRVIAQDLDWCAAYMCYIQLSFYGIDAKIIQGDTLENKSFSNLDDNVFLTPMHFLNGCDW